MKYVLVCFITLLLAVSFCVSSHAADLGKAKATTDNIRQPDPPQVSTTTTKSSPVGQPVSDYKPPAAKSLKIKEPPPPLKK